MPGPKTNQQRQEDDTDLREDLEIDEPEELELPEEPEEPELPEEPEETAVEKRARQLGWHPKHEYRGPPGQWKDAQTFIDNGQNILPVLRDNNKRLLDTTTRQSTEIEGLKKSMAEQAQVLKELRDMARTAGDRGYARALSELEAKRREAVASGDTEGYDQVSEQIRVTEKEREKAIPKDDDKPPVPPANQVPQAVIDFVSENPWYNADKELNDEMQAQHVGLLKKKPSLSLEDNLAQAKEIVMKLHPEKFPRTGAPRQPARNGQAPVAQPSNGRDRQQPRRDDKGIASIEDAGERLQAKQQYERYKRQFPDYTEEEFMAVYSDPHADILTIQRGIKEKRRGKQ